MSQEYMVLLVKEPKDSMSIDGQKAQVFMRFTEEPNAEFLDRIAQANRGWRVYSLLGASTWHSTS